MHVMGMCQAVAQLGHDVTLYARHGDLDIEDDFAFYGVQPIFEISKQFRPQIKALGAFVDAIRTRNALARSDKPDLIYARETWALSLATRLEIPFIFESHWRPRSVTHRCAEARLLRHPQFRRVVFISEALRQMYFDVYPWLKPEMTVVAHDAANIVARSASMRDLDLGRSSALQIGYVGSFQVGCGVELIVDTAKICPDEDFHVFGGSLEEVNSWIERTSKVANVYFHGFVAPNKLGDVYGSLDLTLAPYQASTRSIDWASPMKIFEYMAHGKAIICSDFPVFREVLEESTTGIFAPPDLPEEWANAIRYLKSNRASLVQLGKAARNSLERDFTWLTRATRVLTN